MGEFGFLGGVHRAGHRRPDRRRGHAGDPRAACRCWSRTSSGGTRMQEGTPAFVQMVAHLAAVAAHKAAGLPYLVYLRHPTTGGVFASWGSLGHVTVAEPGALIGFLGPRVFEALYGTRVPGRASRPRRTSSTRASSTRSWPPEDLAGVARPRLRVLLAHRPRVRVAPVADVPRRRRRRATDDHVGVGAADPAAGPAGRPRAARPTAPTTSCPSAAPGRASATPGCCSR